MKGIIKKTSSLDFKTTYQKLRTKIESNPNLKIILELDHSKNANSAGLDLAPTRIILFGNPKLGTVLMKDKQSVAIDLPQKIIVTQDTEGQVSMSYNDPEYLKERHGLESSDEVLKKISKALDMLTDFSI